MFIADATGVDIPSWIWEVVKGVGVGGFALIIWWLERQERLEKEAAAQARYDLLVANLEMISKEAIAASGRVADALSVVKRYDKT